MKTSIYISGQIHGNHILLGACQSSDSIETKERMFYAKEILFPTKKAAKKALWEAYKWLRQGEPEYRGILYYSSGSLQYDASEAKIIRTNK